ncbi:MAG TPA: HAMP domain-containing sensor histidine kinase [Pseudoxanthomonas sp.]|uniref:histidine kinase n=1 Tax=Pseudoxanthomonas helianthi TaxID=1453541 RepID=A0A940X0U4_9GAMM|nr:HAMP domain-containing sensor histidine kinase [Pseudoxanthomonas helianthi]MBP3983111.1 HAMP domain-containing histidine kinase [Pseudoxanthomonas helianthi]HWU71278.1 HAMP domain-containing sensor histidine kinase [Pseudoxanthomonas sp.]
MAATDPAPARRRPVLRRRLRTRIVMSFFLLGLGLTLLLAFATNWVRNRVEEDMITDLMDRNIDAYAQRYFSSGGRDIGLPVQQMYGRVVSKEKYADLKNEYPEWYSLGEGIHNLSGTNEDGTPFSYKLAVRKTPDHWFFLAYDTGESVRRSQKFERALYIVVPVFTVISLLIGWWSASRVMSPVSELALRLRAYRGSSNPRPLAPHFPEDEVGELAKALDDYSQRLTEVVQRDREFNADVSHELRTPLAVIRGATELLLARPDLDEKLVQRLLRIQRAEQQCTDLIGSLLLLSRNERGQGSTLVAKVVEQQLDAHRAQLGNKPIELRMEGESGLTVDAPESALAVALGNLIGNAVKYTQEGSVTVKLHADAVEVIDTGPGLSEEDAARLFERGYRGTHAGHSQGGGIGLSIVRRLCDLYDWQVGVRPGAERGVIATLKFSRAS